MFFEHPSPPPVAKIWVTMVMPRAGNNPGHNHRERKGNRQVRRGFSSAGTAVYPGILLKKAIPPKRRLCHPYGVVEGAICFFYYRPFIPPG